MQSSELSTSLMAEALKSTEGDAELLRDVVEAFLEESPTLLYQLEHAIPRADYVEVRRASHTLKGTLRLFGSTPARDLAADLEEMGKAQSLEHAELKLAALKDSFDLLRSQLVLGLKTLGAQFGQNGSAGGSIPSAPSEMGS
ncbi:MAG: Hpt domain-containing protein [Pirellula sp.]